MTSRICLFQISSSVDTQTLKQAGIDLRHPAWSVLCIKTAYGNHNLPDVGYRLTEYNTDGAARPGPWIVTVPPQSFQAVQDQEIQQIYLFDCEYQPVAVAEDWMPTKRVSVPPELAEEIGMALPMEATP